MKDFFKILFSKYDVDPLEMVEANIKKYRVQYFSVCTMISVFEVYMFIRGLLFFNFEKIERWIYMGCYVSLFLISVLCAILLIRTKEDEQPSKLLKVSVNFYCVFLIVWSAVISILDLMGGNLPLVYMTVIMGTAALAYIKPIVFYSTVIPLSHVMGHFTNVYGKGYLEGNGFLVNFAVFIIITFFIIYRQYKQNVEDYIILKKLESLSYHDQLTGLYNRVLLVKELKETDKIFCFGIFDLDDFKKKNDLYGHDFGDECLKKVGELLKKYYGNKVYRYGGDEFVVLSTEQIEKIKENGKKINEELKATFPNRNVSISGGLYYVTKKENNSDIYLKLADEALYKAKNTGKKKFVLYKDN